MAYKAVLDTGIYGITAEKFSNGKTNIEVVKEMIEAGINMIQYREKEKTKLAKYKECVEIRRMTKEAGVTFIINDDVDIALLVKADGVHIGQDDLPIEQVRKLVGDEMMIGVSTHSSKQAQEAVTKGADYIGVGPLFKTYTKDNVVDPVGLEYLEYVIAHLTIPFVAIGGIKEHNIVEVKNKGAKTICLVTEIVQAEDIGAKVKKLVKLIG